jgi:hypothetical protein
MSLFGGGDRNVHNRGLLAGLSAGTAAVLAVAGLALLLARQAMTTALGDAVWLIFAVLVAAALGGIVLLYRIIWHKHVQYSAVAPARVRARAEIVNTAPAAVTALPQAGIGAPAAVPAIAPPQELHVHLPAGMDPGDVAAVLAELRPGEHPELAGPE